MCSAASWFAFSPCPSWLYQPLFARYWSLVNALYLRLCLRICIRKTQPLRAILVSPNCICFVPGAVLVQEGACAVRCVGGGRHRIRTFRMVFLSTLYCYFPPANGHKYNISENLSISFSDPTIFLLILLLHWGWV